MRYQLELSIVIPICNHYDNLILLTDKIRNTISTKINSYEIIYIDDGSTDGSSRLLDLLAQQYNEVKVFHFPISKGQTSALALGFRKAMGRLVAIMDADLPDDSGNIFHLIPLTVKYDLVCGVKVNRPYIFSHIKMIITLIRNWFRYWMTDEDVDRGCTVKLFKNQVAKDLYLDLHEIIYLYKGMDRYLPTLAKMNGYRVINIPIHNPRKNIKYKHVIANQPLKRLKETFHLTLLK